MARHNPDSRHRIVSLAPSVTSILVALGARRHLVGVTRWCKDVSDVHGLPRLGDCWSADAKEVTRLRPTLVIGSVPYKQEVVAKLLDAGVTFLAMNPRRLQDVYADIRLLGGIVGRPEAARKQIQEMQRHFREIAARARFGRARHAKLRPRVYCEAWPNPRITSPPWVEELVEIAGGKMVLPGGQRVTDDAVARAKPDIIVLAWTATGDRARPERALANPLWKDMPAVRAHRVYVVRDELLNTPGPPLVEGAHALLRIFHPEISP